MKSLIIIFAVFIVGIMFIVYWNYTSNAPIEHTNFNEISWRLPLGQEIKNLGDSFHKNNMDLCANYFIKKFDNEKYLIACGMGDGSWTYYTAYTGQHRVYRTPQKLTSSLMPPQNLVDHHEHDPIKQKSKTPATNKATRESLAR